MGDLNKNLIVEKKNEEQSIKIYKSEKRGVYVVLVLFAISWGLIIVRNFILSLIGWVTLGLIGFSLWRIMEGLFDRIDEKGENEGKGGSK